MIAFTVCSKNFLAFAQSLHASLLTSNGDVTFYVALCDEPAELDLNAFNFEILTIETIGIPRWNEMRDRYNITELNTSIKPFVFLYLFDRYPGEMVYYFDPDILAVSPFDELHELVADGVDCVLTPHVTSPAEFTEETDRYSLIYGVHNLGFCALRSTADVERIVAWWSRRLETECLIDLPRGLFVDQKWADLLPCFIERTKLLRHPGYNVAYWNIRQRRVVFRDREWLVNGVPLRFFHFSGNQIENPEVFARHNPNLTLENIDDTRWLLSQYRESVFRQGHGYFIGLPYAFNWGSDAKDNEHTSASVAETRRHGADPTPFLPLLPAHSPAEYSLFRGRLGAVQEARREIDTSAMPDQHRATTLRGYCVACGRTSSFRSFAQMPWNWGTQLTCTKCGLTARERAVLQILRQHFDLAQSDRILIRGYRDQASDWLRARFPKARSLGSTDRIASEDETFDLIVTAETLCYEPGYETATSLIRRLRPGGGVLLMAPIGTNADIDVSSPWIGADALRGAGFTDVLVIPYWSRELCYLGDPQIVIAARKPEVRALSRPRVALIGHDAKPYGAQMLLLNIVQRMTRHGAVEARILLGGPGPMEEKYRETAPTEVVPGWFGEMALWYEIASRLRDCFVTSVLCNTLVSAKAIPALRAAGLRVITLVHELPALIREYNLVEAAKTAARYSDVVLFASCYVHDRFVEVAGPVAHRHVIRPQGVYFMPPPEPDWPALRAKARAELGAADGELIVLSAAVGDLRKGIDLWPDLVRQVCTICREALFVWAGIIEETLIEQLNRDIRDGGYASHTRLIRQIVDLAPYYAAADVFLLPSREDPYPSVVLEAMAYGVPVVAFDGAGGITDLLNDTGNTPVPYLDTARMAARIVELLRSANLRDTLGVAGRDRIARDYDFAGYIAELCNLANDAPRAVSVVVPNYNYAHYLRERIASIQAQTYPIHEIILLDDASTDESLSLIAEIERESKIRLRVVSNTENSGSAVHQWMRGVELAEGELVWIAEADDRSDPGFLAATVRAFDDYSVVLSYSQSRQIDGAGIVLREDYFDYLDDVDPVRWRHDYIRSGIAEIAYAMSVKNTIPNVSAVVFRRTAVAEVLRKHREELIALRNAADWCCYLHLIRHGSVAFTARTLNSHRRHAHSVTLSTNDRRHLDEIGQMQRLAAKLATVPPDRIVAARNWRRAVARLFDLIDEETPDGEGIQAS